MTSLEFTQAQGLGYTRGMYRVPLSIPTYDSVTSKMIFDHQGGEPERACIVDLMFCHGTQIIVLRS